MSPESGIEGSQLSNTELASQTIIGLVERYRNLPLGGKSVAVSYWMNNYPPHKGTPEYFYVPMGGKHNPEEIVDLINNTASKILFNLSDATGEEIRSFMRDYGIGLDCSGFAYRSLEEVCGALDQDTNFQETIYDVNGEHYGARRVNVKTLTNEFNSLFLDDMSNLLPGDLVRCSEGSHVILVARIFGDMITCYHSNHNSNYSGIQELVIQLIDKNKGVFDQKWSNIDEPHALQVDERDGLYRLGVIQDIYYK